MPKHVARLFTQFQPDTYDLTIAIDEDGLYFYGTVRITGKKTSRPSKRLTFHANGVKVTSVNVQKRDKKGHDTVVPIERVNHHRTLQEVRLHSSQMIYPGDYIVEMQFRSPITEGMTGIYPCNWQDEHHQQQKLIATQFESHHAREAFPCIDEPEAKAVFNLTLITRQGIVTLSNTPVRDQRSLTDNDLLQSGFEKLSGGATAMTAVTFEPTPRMSTYLLAFVTGDMHKKSTVTTSGVEVNIWATTAQPVESLEFALDSAKRSIEYFEEYFSTPYPLPKADHVALPDFSSGAMENWGLITYRERVLLAYPGEAAPSTLERIALVIAHETSHQWFGNLVTMRWWDNLWLNESFANVMEYAAVDALFPEWHVWETFIADEGLSAFRRDAIAGVQAVECSVNHPDEISSLFDPSIVYAKGGRLLYMLQQYIGEDAWRKGLSAYFKKHAYGNTIGNDLWAALSEASGKDIAGFMVPWLTRSGFPMLSVEQTGRTIRITQSHFQDNPTKADSTRLWQVPTFSNQPSLPPVITTEELQFTSDTDSELRLNTGARGHYIVNYKSKKTREHIAESIRGGTLAEADRLMYLSDNTMLARAGYQSYREPLELLSQYKNEASEPVWGIISLVAGEVRRFIDVDETLEAAIKKYTRELIAVQHKRLGWAERDSESAADKKLRGTILALGLYGDDEAIIDHAKALFDDFMSKDTALTPELRDLIMCVPIKQGDPVAFDYLLQLHDRTQNSELKSDICNALTTTQDPEKATELLARITDSTLIKPQDADRWLFYLMRNRHTRDIAWQWMVDHWVWIEKTFQNDKTYDYMPRYAASVVNTPLYRDRFHELFDDKINQPLLARNIALGSEEISVRLEWLARDLSNMQAFFDSPAENEDTPQ